jgi:hypothetical protein
VGTKWSSETQRDSMARSPRRSSTAQTLLYILTHSHILPTDKEINATFHRIQTVPLSSDTTSHVFLPRVQYILYMALFVLSVSRHHFMITSWIIIYTTTLDRSLCRSMLCDARLDQQPPLLYTAQTTVTRTLLVLMAVQPQLAHL